MSDSVPGEFDGRVALVTSETFTEGGGGFSRVVYAATNVQSLESDLDSVGEAVGRTMTDTQWIVLRSTQDNMVHLGMPEEIDR